MTRPRGVTNPEVMALVEAVLDERPNATVPELRQMAIARDPTIAELTPRQFHGRYPLQVKRRKLAEARRTVARGESRGRSRTGRRAAHRDAIRSVFLAFASDLAAAEARKDLVRVLADVDRYVDEVLEVDSR